jgi:hypothetical protein
LGHYYAAADSEVNLAVTAGNNIIGPSLNPQHLKRYKDIAFLLIKHGRSDLLANSGLH